MRQYVVSVHRYSIFCYVISIEHILGIYVKLVLILLILMLYIVMEVKYYNNKVLHLQKSSFSQHLSIFFSQPWHFINQWEKYIQNIDLKIGKLFDYTHTQ